MLQECTVTGEQEPLKNKVSIKTAWREINTISEIYFLVRRNIICVLRSVVVGRLRPLHCLLKLYQLMLHLCHACLRCPQFRRTSYNRMSNGSRAVAVLFLSQVDLTHILSF